MDVSITKEFFNRGLIDEITPTLITHLAEVDLNSGQDMNVDWPMYQAMQEGGQYHFFVLRINGWVRGYVGYITSPSLHYKGKLQALCDLIYIHPEVRGYMLSVRLLKHVEKAMVEIKAISI